MLLNFFILILDIILLITIQPGLFECHVFFLTCSNLVKLFYSPIFLIFGEHY